eukprot:13434775-Heterocapsa_arctica.AAC.1
MSAMRVEMPGPAISFQANATAGHQIQRCQALLRMLSGSGGVPSMALESGWGRVPSMRSRSHLQGAAVSFHPGCFSP